MSAQATFWAWEQDVSSSEKLVLLSLANCHNENTQLCYPSIKYVSGKTGLDKKTVSKCILNLEKKQIILAKKTLGKSTYYTLVTTPKIGTTTEIGTTPKIGLGSTPKIGPTPPPKLGHESKSNLKTKSKINTYKKIRLENISNDFEIEAVTSFIDHRKNIKKPLTQRAFNSIIQNALLAASELKKTPNWVLDETVIAGWQSFEIDWLKKRIGEKNANSSRNIQSQPDNSAAGRVRAEVQELQRKRGQNRNPLANDGQHVRA